MSTIDWRDTSANKNFRKGTTTMHLVTMVILQYAVVIGVVFGLVKIIMWK